MRARRPRTRHARGSIILHFAIERSIVVRLSWLKPWLRSGKPCGLDQPGAPGTGKGEGHASPAGASTRSGRTLARTTSDDGRCQIASLVDRRSFWSSHRAHCSQEYSALPDGFNLCENCRRVEIAPGLLEGTRPDKRKWEHNSHLPGQGAVVPHSTRLRSMLL